MDSNKQEQNKETPKAKNETQKNSINENQHGVVPIDPPPSYSEAIQIHPYQDLSYSTPRPTAPPSETNNAISYPYNNYAPGSFPPPGVPNDKRFQRWDNNATRIIIVKRLQMNDRFQTANTSWETELLWNIIRNDLLIHGYNFTIFDLMDYWAFVFRTYIAILDAILPSNAITSDWEYFEPMKQVFGTNSSSLVNSLPTSGPTVLPVTSTLPDTTILPIVMHQHHTLPATEASRAADGVELSSSSSTLPNTASNLPNSADHFSSSNNLAGISASSSTTPLISNEKTPLLQSTSDTPNLQTDILSKTSTSTDALPSSAYTVLPASATLPSTSVVPAVITMPPSDIERLPNDLITQGNTLTGPTSSTTGELLNSANLSSIEQAPSLLTGDGISALKSSALLGKPARSVTESVLPIPANDVAASAGESCVVSGGVDNLMKCIPPVDLSTSAATEGIAAITSQPVGSAGVKLLLDDVITSQPDLSATIPPPEAYADDYGCCDGCCGDDFCCEDCYCEGGDCDIGDCGGL